MSTAVNNKKRGAPGSSSEQPASKLPALSARAETESSPTRGAPSTAVAPPTAAAALPRGPSRANLNYLADWSALVAKGLENLVSVTFAPDFPVKDEHVTQIVEAAGPKLVELTLGCNNTGNGYCVTDAAVRLVAQRCPNLRTLQLKSCTGITDAAFLAVLSSLTKLQKLACTGNDRVAGEATRLHGTPACVSAWLAAQQRSRTMHTASFSSRPLFAQQAS